MTTDTPKPKRKRGASPSARTLKALRDLGFVADVVERRNPVLKFKTHDFIGCVDIIAAREGIGILAVQACAGASHAARRAKAAAEPRLRTWLEAGGRFEVISWSKRGKANARKVWEWRREELRLDDLTSAAPAAAHAEAK